jgi:anthranilate synthase component 1
MGFKPVLEFVAKSDKLTIHGEPEAIKSTFGLESTTSVQIEGGNPFEFIKDNVPLKYTSGPHQGGLIGYFCYESVNYFEPSLTLEESPDFDTFNVGLFSDGIVFDSATGIMSYYTYGEDRSSEILELVDKLDAVEIPKSVTSVTNLGHNISRDEHTVAVATMLDEIRAGNTFQGEVGFKTHYDISGDKIAIYDKLRQVNPSPYMFYVKFNEVELLGASPEILMSTTNGAVLTTPTAGTIKRDDDPKVDIQLARQLLTDPKEIAEHNMLVDLHRNDISKVCKIGSVKVNDLMYLIKFSHVQHIVSDIQGELADGKTAYDLLAAVLPGGVLTGAPKIETIKIINRNEKAPRGPYGGAVGRFGMNGDAAFCLPIRSLFCKGDNCFTQTSSGIVLDSTPEREFDEVSHKLAAMEQTIKSCADDARAKE